MSGYKRTCVEDEEDVWLQILALTRRKRNHRLAWWFHASHCQDKRSGHKDKRPDKKPQTKVFQTLKDTSIFWLPSLEVNREQPNRNRGLKLNSEFVFLHLFIWCSHVVWNPIKCEVTVTPFSFQNSNVTMYSKFPSLC